MSQLVVLLSKSRARIEGSLAENGVAVPIDPLATVQIWLRHNGTAFAGPFAVVSATAGSNWPAGKWVAVIPTASTNAWTARAGVTVEMAVTVGGETDRWESDPIITIRKGT